MDQEPSSHIDIATIKQDIKNYVPSAEQLAAANDLTMICTQSEQAGVKVSVAGGYGLDALYGALTRDHGDYDLLIANGDAPVLSDVLSQQGYIPDIEESNEFKHVYKKPGRKLEVGSVSVAAQALGISEAQLLPSQPNACLLGTDLYTPTLEAHTAIILMQNKRAEQEGWQEYSPEKRANQQALLELLSEK